MNPTPTEDSDSKAAQSKSIHTAPSMVGEHWYWLTGTLDDESRGEFGLWMSEQLEALELELAHFTSPRSRQTHGAKR